MENPDYNKINEQNINEQIDAYDKTLNSKIWNDFMNSPTEDDGPDEDEDA